MNFYLFKDMTINGQAVVQLSLDGNIVWKKGDEPIPIALSVGDMFPEEFKVKKSDVIDYDNHFYLDCYVLFDKEEGYEEPVNLNFYWNSDYEEVSVEYHTYVGNEFDVTYDDEWVYVSLNGNPPYEISYIYSQPDQTMYKV